MPELNLLPSLIFGVVLVYFAYRGRAAFFNAWASASAVERIMLVVAYLCLLGMALVAILGLSGFTPALLGLAAAATVVRWILRGLREGKIGPRRQAD